MWFWRSNMVFLCSQSEFQVGNFPCILTCCVSFGHCQARHLETCTFPESPSWCQTLYHSQPFVRWQILSLRIDPSVLACHLLASHLYLSVEPKEKKKKKTELSTCSSHWWPSHVIIRHFRLFVFFSVLARIIWFEYCTAHQWMFIRERSKNKPMFKTWTILMSCRRGLSPPIEYDIMCVLMWSHSI